jgi:Ca2+-binding EF-hand superfamily protein
MKSKRKFGGCCVTFPCECLPVYDFVTDRVRFKLLTCFFIVSLLLNFYQVATANAIGNYIIICIYLIIFGPFLFSNTQNSNKISIILFCVVSVIYHLTSFFWNIYSVVMDITFEDIPTNWTIPAIQPTVAGILQFQNFTSNQTAQLQEPFYNAAINFQHSILDLFTILSTIILFVLAIFQNGDLQDYQRKIRNYKNLSVRILTHDPEYVKNEKKLFQDYLTPQNMEEEKVWRSYMISLKNGLIHAARDIYEYIIPHNPHKSLESFWEFYFPARFLTGWILTVVVGLISLYVCFFAVFNLSKLIVVGLYTGLKIYKDLCKLGLPICILSDPMIEIIWITVGGMIWAVTIVPIIISFLWLLISLVSVPLEYKKRILEMRHGVYHFDKKIVNPFNATRYIGYIVGNVLLGTILLYGFIALFIMAIGVCVVVFTLWPGIWGIVQSRYLGPFLSVTIPAIILRFLVIWFLDTLLVRKSWYRFLVFFSYVDIAMMFYSSVTGIMSSLFNGIIIPVIYRAFTMIRPDRTLYAHDPTWDPMYSAYLSTLYTDHCHNNPLLLTLGEKYLQRKYDQYPKDSDLMIPLKESVDTKPQYSLFKILRILWILKSTKFANHNNVTEVLNHVQLDECRESFSILNTKKVEKIASIQVFYAFRSMGFPVKMHHVEDLLSLVANEKGKIEFIEFLSLLKFSLAPLDPDQIKEFFDELDPNGTGVLTEASLLQEMHQFDRFRTIKGLSDYFQEANVADGITIELMLEGINL